VALGHSTDSSVAGPAPERIRAIPARHPWRWVAAAIIALYGAALAYSMATNSRYQWSVVRHYLFDSSILHGVRITIELTVISMVLGIVIGVVLAIMRLSPNPIVSGSSWLYIWFFRGTPLLVQVLFWGTAIQALYPRIGVVIPFGPTLVSENSVQLISIFTAAILALSLNEGAYMAEIVRAGILAVDEGQHEAAASIGMSRLQTMRRVILPQAMRVIIPPTGNETISMLKNTSLISVLGYAELLYSGQIIYARTFQEIPLLIVVSIWYIVLTSILYVAQYYIERHYARGTARALPPTALQRMRLSIASRGSPTR
jgi:polar amino acid transport system permease protein